MTLVACILLVAGGFLLPFWPLSLLGVLVAALSGRWVVGLSLGLLLDSAYGPPVGPWHFLYMPFTLAALSGILAYYFFGRYMRKFSQNTL